MRSIFLRLTYIPRFQTVVIANLHSRPMQPVMPEDLGGRIFRFLWKAQGLQSRDAPYSQMYYDASRYQRAFLA